MAKVVLGSQGEYASNNGNIGGRSVYGFITPALAQDLRPIQGACFVRAMGSTLLRMYIYEWNAATPSASTFVTRSAVLDPTDQEQVIQTWLYFVGFDGPVTLEAGKQYYIAFSANGYGGTVPYYVTTGGVHGAWRTSAGSFPQVPWEAGELPSLSTIANSGSGLGAAVIPSMYLECTTTEVAVDNVNDDNIIVRNGPIVINGTFPELDELTVELGGHPLTVESATNFAIVCSPVDVFTTPLSFGSHALSVTAGAVASVTVYLEVDAEHQAAVLDSISPPLITEGLSAAIGDQIACPVEAGGAAMVLTSGGDVTYSPAVPDATTHQRYWYDASTEVWDSGPVIINGSDVPGTPTISLFTAVTDTAGEVTLRGVTDTTSGTVYAVVDASSARPTATRIRDGLNAAGAPALGKGSAAVSTADLSVTITGLPSDTLLYGWLAQWV